MIIVITVIMIIVNIISTLTLIEGNMESGGGRLQWKQERPMYLQLGGTPQVTFFSLEEKVTFLEEQLEIRKL